jgi:hypothetical protein
LQQGFLLSRTAEVNRALNRSRIEPSNRFPNPRRVESGRGRGKEKREQAGEERKERNRERKIETEWCGEFRDRERNREGVHQKCRDRGESLA